MKLHKNVFKFMVAALMGIFLSTAYASNFEQMGKKVDDAVITSSVKLLFAKDPLVNALDINVSTKDGDVALVGTVDADMAYERAVILAQSVDGVKDVTADNLKVKDSKQPATDIFITAKVKGSILKDKLFTDQDVQHWPIKVETKNGVVYLSGQVDTNQQKNNIVKIAQSVKGVQSTQDTITVESSNT